MLVSNVSSVKINFQNWDFDAYYIYPRFKGPVKTKADYMTAPGIKRTG